MTGSTKTWKEATASDSVLRLRTAFGPEDTELFSLTDADLKAKALRYDVIPRLELLLQRALTEVQKIYGSDPLELSTVATTPAFRTNRRKGDVEHHYEHCSAGITGKRSIVWNGVERIDGKPAKILPFRFEFVLDESGISLALNCWWTRPYSQATHDRFHSLLLDKSDTLFQIMQIGSIFFTPSYFDVLSFRANLEHLAQEPADPWLMTGKTHPVPLEAEAPHELLLAFLLLYPIYDGMVQIATKQPLRFDEQIAALQGYLESHDPAPVRTGSEALMLTQGRAMASERQAELESKAEKRVPVLSGVRWQVLLRDGWKCLACGRNTIEHGVVLHLDHIVPRSRGGKDEVANYQTLCEQCNIGKSNKDDTDIRRSHSSP